jgi:hypothetical protein
MTTIGMAIHLTREVKQKNISTNGYRYTHHFLKNSTAKHPKNVFRDRISVPTSNNIHRLEAGFLNVEVVLQFHRSGPPELWTHQITICSRTLAGEFLNAWRKFPCLITLRTVSGLAMNSSCMHIIHRESNDKFMWKMDVSTTFYLCIFFLSLLLFVFPLGTEGMRMPWTIGIVAFTKCSQCLNFMWKVQLKQNNSCS